MSKEETVPKRQAARDAYDLKYYKDLTEQEKSALQKATPSAAREHAVEGVDIAFRALEAIPPAGYHINSIELVDIITRQRVSVRCFDGDIKGASTVVEVSISDPFPGPLRRSARIYIAVKDNVKTLLAIEPGAPKPYERC